MFDYFRNCSSNAHQVCCEDSPTKGLYDHCQSDDLDLHSRSQVHLKLDYFCSFDDREVIVGRQRQKFSLIILTTKQATSIKLCTMVGHFFTWPWLCKCLYGLTSLFVWLCLPVCPVVYIFFYLSVSACLSVNLSVFLLLCLSVIYKACTHFFTLSHAHVKHNSRIQSTCAHRSTRLSSIAHIVTYTWLTDTLCHTNLFYFIHLVKHVCTNTHTHMNTHSKVNYMYWLWLIKT